MKRGDPLERRTPLKRSQFTTREQRLAGISPKRLNEQERRQEVVRATRERAGGKCEAGPVHALTGIPCMGELDTHELLPRGQWRAGYLNTDNTALCCRRSHDWITTHAYGAHALGFRLWAHERSVVESGAARSRIEGR